MSMCVCVCLQLCVPDWPMYNRNKLTWLPPLKPAPAAAVVASAEEEKREETAADAAAPIE